MTLLRVVEGSGLEHQWCVPWPGKSGRTPDSEIYAAPLAFPVAVARGLRALGPANLARAGRRGLLIVRRRGWWAWRIGCLVSGLVGHGPGCPGIAFRTMPCAMLCVVFSALPLQKSLVVSG